MLSHKELMLGNWVYESERSQFPMEVVNIDKDMVYLDFEGNEGDWFDGRMEDICPIQLTEGILLKNNFAKEYNSFYNKGNYVIELSDIGEGRFNIALGFGDYYASEIKYVHQLQNILTIAGIDIDFKI